MKKNEYSYPLVLCEVKYMHELKYKKKNAKQEKRTIELINVQVTCLL